MTAENSNLREENSRLKNRILDLEKEVSPCILKYLQIQEI